VEVFKTVTFCMFILTSRFFRGIAPSFCVNGSYPIPSLDCSSRQSIPSDKNQSVSLYWQSSDNHVIFSKVANTF
jgi:hypothetical protein